MPSSADLRSSVLASNVTQWVPSDPIIDGGEEQTSELIGDLVVAGGGLALVVTAVVVYVGPLLGGPVPTVRLWSTVGPLLVVPLAILLGVLLTPGGVLHGRTADWRTRLTYGLAACAAFALPLVFLNLPTFMTR